LPSIRNILGNKKLESLFFVCYFRLATIILFFTNQNASIAMSKMPQVANYSASQVDGYLDNDIPVIATLYFD
jgi:hypothetical protein